MAWLNCHCKSSFLYTKDSEVCIVFYLFYICILKFSDINSEIRVYQFGDRMIFKFQFYTTSYRGGPGIALTGDSLLEGANFYHFIHPHFHRICHETWTPRQNPEHPYEYASYLNPLKILPCRSSSPWSFDYICGLYMMNRPETAREWIIAEK